MKSEGKKINFLGDSITEGVGVTNCENVFWRQFEVISGAVCKGYGIGGTRIAKIKNPTDASFDKTDTHFNTRVGIMDKDADVIVVFGGTNDYGHGDAPLGEEDSLDEYTFYGALNTLCNNLIENFPNARIVFMTPLHRTGENNLWNERGIRNVCPLSGYVNAIKKVCRNFSFPVIDCYSMSGINPNNEIIKTNYMPDGLHPNDAGHKKLAEFIFEQFKTF